MLFLELTEIFEKLESTSKRLEMTDDLAKLFANARQSEVKHLTYLTQGILVPSHFGIELGIGDKLAEQAISLVSGKSIREVEALYRKTGDLGDAARQLLEKKEQKSLVGLKTGLTSEKVYENFYKIATTSGEGSQDFKISLLGELLTNAEANEAKVIIRFVTGNLRLGIAEATIIDSFSVVKSGDKSLKPVIERAFNLTSDLGLVAELLFTKGLSEVEKIIPTPFHPIRPALAERLPSAKEIIEKIGECAAEGKYDGLRLQIHREGDRVEIYSRKQEKITHMFPDVVTAVKKQFSSTKIIFEGEALAIDEEGNSFAFQETIQRKRKHGIAEKIGELPLKLFAFELLYADGRDYTNTSFSERRKKLESLIVKKGLIEPSRLIYVKTPKQLERFFLECVEQGLEGVMAKDLASPYVAGARKFAWIKLKKSYSTKLSDTLDVVVIGYYYGKGKRTKFGFGGLLTAIYEPSKNRFRSIAKIGTGFTEKELQAFSDSLTKLITKQKPPEVDSLLTPDEWVLPRVVVEVNADEITRSPMHTCGMSEKQGGLALRFPRLISIREDKLAKDATTEEEVISLYELQGKNRIQE